MNKKIAKIALIDSGYGGLLLSSEIHKNFPSLEIVYIGDTKNMPYGEKSIHFLNDRYNKLQEFVKEQNVDLLIVACNTLSATSYLSEKKSVDTLDIISISADFINKSGIEKLILVATPNTINSKIYQKNLNKNIELKEVQAKGLASLIENSNLLNAVLEFESLIRNYQGQIMLGCTHYSVLKPEFPDLNMISQDVILNEYLKENYKFFDGERGEVKLFVNADLEKYTGFAKNLFKQSDFEIKLVDF